MQQIHALSLRLATSSTLADVLLDVLRTAAKLLDAPMGSAQIVAPNGTLEMVGQVGFDESVVEKFSTVRLEDCSTCAVALKRRSRVVVRNLHADDNFADIAKALLSYGAVGAVSTPVLDNTRKVLAMYSLYWPDEYVPSDRGLKILDLCAELAGRHVERSVAAKALYDREQRLLATYENGPVGIVEIDFNGRLVATNQQFRELVGFADEELKGLSIANLIHPDDRAAHDDTLRRLVAGEMPVVETEKRYVRKNGSTVWVSVRRSLLKSEIARTGYVIEVNVDITARKAAEDALRDSKARQSLLMRELAHRGKNLISVIQAIAGRSLGGQRSLDDARKVFNGRLQALANTYSTLTDEAPESAELHSIVAAGLNTLGNRAAIRGPVIEVSAKNAQTLSLVFHELATNAAKYGALSVPTGRVEVIWAICTNGSDDEEFSLTWIEKGGPPAATPTHKGFGSTIVTKIIGADLRCEPSLEYTAEGFRYGLKCPSSVLAGTPS